MTNTKDKALEENYTMKFKTSVID